MLLKWAWSHFSTGVCFCCCHGEWTIISQAAFVRGKRNGDVRTGCHCPVKPPGCAGKPGQEQQLTHTQQLTKNDTHSLSLAREQHGFLLTYMQTNISCNCLSSLSHAAVCLGSRGTGPLKAPRCSSLLRPLISCDRCISPGGVEFEVFIKAHESIKNRIAVGHEHMIALFPPM